MITIIMIKQKKYSFADIKAFSTFIGSLNDVF